jgi:hypothetical protein
LPRRTWIATFLGPQSLSPSQRSAMEPILVQSPPADPEAVARLGAAYALPDSYLDFLRRANGAEGDLGVNPGYFVIWPAEEALVATVECEMPDYLPGYFAFGGNGGGEYFVFRLDAGAEDRPVLMVPAIGMEEAVLLPVTTSFAEFVDQLGRTFEEEG